jgi:hypothetical protein
VPAPAAGRRAGAAAKALDPLLLGSPQRFALGCALGFLLGPEAGVCGSLLGPVQLLGSLELLADLGPGEIAAEGRVRDAVVGSEEIAAVLEERRDWER